MTKIVIIGAGWYGCYISYYINTNYKNKFDITLVEKDSDIFMGSSSKNQNRLHLGFHYPRNYDTRTYCLNNFERFKKKFPNIVDNIENNFYLISKDSILDYKTYINIYKYENYQKYFKEIDDISEFNNIDGKILNVREMIINPDKAKIFFKNELKNIKKIFNYNVFSINKYENDIIINNQYKFDIVFNCTYNQILSFDNTIYEKCITLLYKNINPINFNCLTVMDGKFSSLYKYNNDLYTLTDVEYTPFARSDKFEDLVNKNMTDKQIKEIIQLCENRITEYYPIFKNNFEYNSYYISYKCKNKSGSDSRKLNINIKDNIISIFCGKISLLLDLDEEINKILQTFI